MNSIKNYFFKGLLYIVPISALCWVIYKSYVVLNQILKPYLEDLHLEYLGVIILFFLITLVGYLGSVVISSPLNIFFHKLLDKAPLLKTIYSSVQDLMSTFVGDKKGFSEPVLVKLFENSTIERIGFVTNEDVESLNIKKGKVLVYMPHSYAISGNLFIVEKKDVTPIKKSSSEIMKLVISGGVTEVQH